LITRETGLKQFLTSETLSVMFDMVKKVPFHLHQFRHIALRSTLTDENDSMNVIEGLMIVLETIAEYDTAQIAVVDGNLLDILFDFVDYRSLDTEDTDTVLEEDGATSYASVRLAITKVVTNITMCGIQQLI
jgi:hypothetical protein